MILVPRPAPHLPRTLEALHAAGLSNLLPLPLSHPQGLPVTLPASTTALIFTSIFGIQPGLPSLPAYSVGDATAHAARSHGLLVTYPGTSNGATLAEDIVHLNLPPQHFAHLHGDHAAREWHTTLTKAGHRVTSILAYHTHRITTLPPEITTALLNPHSSLLIPLFSAGTANHLANLLKQVNIQPNGTAIALSPAVAHAAAAHWPHVVTAPAPTLSAMVATIRGLQG